MLACNLLRNGGYRVAGLFVLAGAWVGLLADPASAAVFQTEQEMRDATSTAQRNTYILPGEAGKMLTRADLLEHRGYYDSFGFDENFLTWAPQVKMTPSSSDMWSYCESRSAAGPCPSGNVGYDEIRDVIGTGDVTVLKHGGAYLSLACGNFSPGHVPAGDFPTVSGLKYEDLDGDGQRDAGEPTLKDWKIKLFYEGQAVAETQTGPDGTYSFHLDATKLTAGGNPIGGGTYQVTEIVQPGWKASETPAQFEVPWGVGSKHYANKDFGNYRPASVSGLKVEDLDADGVDAADPGLENWTIRITGKDRPSDSAVTDSDGRYLLSDLRPGKYTVSELEQPGWIQSVPASQTYVLTLSSGQSVEGIDFANYRLGAIEGRKFDDQAVDGGGAGDPGLPGWVIGIEDGPKTTTGADGSYAFEDLVPGMYELSEVLQDGWRQTAPIESNHLISVRSGNRITERDFGNVCLGDVAINVADVTGGSTDLGLEIVLEEVEVPGILDNEPALPQSGIDRYSFEDLLPGRYRLTAFLPSDVFTADPDARLVDGRWAIVKELDVTNCATTEVDLEVFTDSEGKITGGVKQPIDGGAMTSGFQFQSRRGVPSGMLELQDHAAGHNLHTDLIDGILVVNGGTEAVVWGLVEFNGEQLRFRLRLFDRGEPGNADGFEFDLDGYAVGHDVAEVNGNVQIHPAKP